MPEATEPATRTRLLLVAVSVLILLLGAVENLYGNTDSGDVYGSDAVQYLDIARAVGHGDWTTIRTVNFSIFAANYAAFLFLIFELIEKLRVPHLRRSFIAPKVGWIASNPSGPDKRRRRMFEWAAALSLFVATQVCLGQVSRVNPDELVTAVFLALGCGMLVLLAIALSQRRSGFGIFRALAPVEITSEIASPRDFDLFWQMPPAEQARTLTTFERSGAVAVFSHGKPQNAGSPHWSQLANTSMWVYTF